MPTSKGPPGPKADVYRKALEKHIRAEAYAAVGLAVGDPEFWDGYTQCPEEIALIVSALEEIVQRRTETVILTQRTVYHG